MLTIPSGSLPEVFGLVAQTLSQKGIILDYYFLLWDKVWATKMKTSGNEPKGIGNDDLDGQQYHALRFRLRDCAHKLLIQLFKKFPLALFYLMRILTILKVQMQYKI